VLSRIEIEIGDIRILYIYEPRTDGETRTTIGVGIFTLLEVSFDLATFAPGGVLFAP
jgi:hypothetical protein